MNFRITGLPAEHFSRLFSLSDDELKARHAIRRIADGPGYPCRISLTDAQAGDEVLLVNYEHHPVNTPFRSSHAIYVRAGEETYDEVNQVPEQLRRRLLSIRAYDAQGLLLDADVTEGRELASCVKRLLENEQAAYLHAHYAKPGCYAARIERAHDSAGRARTFDLPCPVL
jgi:hypothetical protein